MTKIKLFESLLIGATVVTGVTALNLMVTPDWAVQKKEDIDQIKKHVEKVDFHIDIINAKISDMMDDKK